MQQTSLNFDSPLSTDEAAVLALLGHGRGAAVSSTEIVKRTGLSERKVQQVIRSLRMKHGYPIGAAVEEPFGYYIADKQEELADMARALRSRALKVLAVAARFSRRSLRMEFDQGCLEQEDE
ncbi:MAG TPA: hypothetical protein PLT30_16070 [Deltaproteobacteria bacterium]|jgi:biotin operon repressor|nr:hypothetical protein [Deltaproteobacteria bacterium]